MDALNGLKFPEDWINREFSNKLLISDDDPYIQELLGEVFQRENYETIKADSGRKTLEQIIYHKPKVVVLDMMLPKGSGFLVLEKVRKVVPDKEKPPYFIMITANEGKRHELYARTFGVVEYLTKPFSNNSIVEVVKKYSTK